MSGSTTVSGDGTSMFHCKLEFEKVWPKENSTSPEKKKRAFQRKKKRALTFCFYGQIYILLPIRHSAAKLFIVTTLLNLFEQDLNRKITMRWNHDIMDSSVSRLP